MIINKKEKRKWVDKVGDYISKAIDKLDKEVYLYDLDVCDALSNEDKTIFSVTNGKYNYVCIVERDNTKNLDSCSNETLSYYVFQVKKYPIRG